MTRVKRHYRLILFLLAVAAMLIIPWQIIVKTNENYRNDFIVPCEVDNTRFLKEVTANHKERTYGVVECTNSIYIEFDNMEEFYTISLTKTPYLYHFYVYPLNDGNKYLFRKIKSRIDLSDRDVTLYKK